MATTTSRHTETIDLCLFQIASEYLVFRALGGLRPTVTGLDKLPAWFLRLGAAAFCGSVITVFNLSLYTLPDQWKQACIKPIPKLATQL